MTGLEEPSMMPLHIGLRWRITGRFPRGVGRQPVSGGARDQGPRFAAGVRGTYRRGRYCLLATVVLLSWPASCHAAAPPLVTELTARDHPWDGGDKIDLSWRLPAGARDAAWSYQIFRGAEPEGRFLPVQTVSIEDVIQQGSMARVTIEKLHAGEPYYFGVATVDADGQRSAFVRAGPVAPRRQWFDGSRVWLALITAVLCGAIVFWIRHARAGGRIKVRTIPGLQAVDEAVGRATEMGRPCLYVPGILDMNDIQTVASMSILAHVARTAAQYGATVEVPTSRSLVMTTARETVQEAFLEAGRPDAYVEDDVYYVTDEQFGYVAYLSGTMVREKPAACFYMGAFFAESLILAENANAVGAIQVAGTAMPAQLPFFVAACDYTLIGEEFFAASAYLSGDPEQLGSLKGQDLGKILVGVTIIAGCGMATLQTLFGTPALTTAVTYLTETVLK